jgi:DNA-binding NarL/FixJ family response regulator
MVLQFNAPPQQNDLSLPLGLFSRYPIRLYLSAPDELLLRGLKALVHRWAPEIRQVGESTTVANMLSECPVVQPTVILMDHRYVEFESPDWEALAAQVPILVLVEEMNSPSAFDALDQGARGVLVHKDAPIKLIQAIERLHAGDCWVPPLLAKRHRAHPMAGRLYGNMHRLTPSELETARTMLEYAGAKNLVVAQALNISESTLRNRLTVIYDKLGLPGKAALVLYARENGLHRPYL